MRVCELECAYVLGMCVVVRAGRDSSGQDWSSTVCKGVSSSWLLLYIRVRAAGCFLCRAVFVLARTAWISQGNDQLLPQVQIVLQELALRPECLSWGGGGEHSTAAVKEWLQTRHMTGH